MQKVGIITVHRLPNWGSVMQGYALQQVIKQLGYKSECIDYKYPNEWHIERGSWIPGKERFKTKFARLLGLRAPRLQNLVDKFINNEMQVSRKYNTFEDLHANPPQYDIYISGSDQIWNWKTMCVDTSYMLDFAPDDKPKIAYSSSFSVNHIPNEYCRTYKVNLAKYKAISTREKNGCKIVKKLLGKDIPVVLDPTLLIAKEQWGRLAEKAVWKKPMPPKYILCYLLGYTYNPKPAMASLLENLQQKFNCPVIMLGNTFSEYHGQVFRMAKSQGIGVYEFLWLIKNATIFATSSFHGTAFSVNLGTPFLSLVEKIDQEDDRITSFLEKVGLTKQIVTVSTDFEHLDSDGRYDVVKAQNKLQAMRSESLDWLKNALKEE